MQQERRCSAASPSHGRQQAQYAQDKRGGGPVAAASRNGGQQQLQDRLAVKLTLPSALAGEPGGQLTFVNPDPRKQNCLPIPHEV
jgi:hypothetical protein